MGGELRGSKAKLRPHVWELWKAVWSESNFLECSFRGGVAKKQRSQVRLGEDAVDVE